MAAMVATMAAAAVDMRLPSIGNACARRRLIHFYCMCERCGVRFHTHALLRFYGSREALPTKCQHTPPPPLRQLVIKHIYQLMSVPLPRAFMAGGVCKSNS